jgi:hypothetical protein
MGQSNGVWKPGLPVRYHLAAQGAIARIRGHQPIWGRTSQRRHAAETQATSAYGNHSGRLRFDFSLSNSVSITRLPTMLAIHCHAHRDSNLANAYPGARFERRRRRLSGQQVRQVLFRAASWTVGYHYRLESGVAHLARHWKRNQSEV